MTDKAADKPLITKVMTFKSGKVSFSRKYRREAVGEDLVRFESLYQALSGLPVLPAMASQLDTDLIRRSIFGTAAIEGNQLSEERVGELLAEPPGGVRERAEQEIVNLGQAYKLFAAQPAGKFPAPFLVTEEFIRQINATITDNIAHENHAPGQYRNHRVEVGNKDHGGAYVPPKIRADIEPLMAAFVDWINSEEVIHEGALLRAALAHYHLALIHPFGDGNGRTARLLEAVLLCQGGYRFIPAMMSNYYYSNIDDYYIAFRKAEKAQDNDVTGFVELFVKMLLLSIKDIQDRIHWHIRILTLKNFYAYCLETRSITQRQHDLLNLLLQHPGKTLTLKDLHLDSLFASLYRRVTGKTARRDLERLETRGLLLRKEKNYHSNPFVLG